MDTAYRPSNGTEGMIFMEHFCFRCKKDAFDESTGQGGCEIIAATMAYGRDAPEYPKEWVWNPGKCLTPEHGLEFGGEFSPRCTAFAVKG